MPVGMPLCALLPAGLPRAGSEVAGRETCSGLLLTEENTSVTCCLCVEITNLPEECCALPAETPVTPVL